MKQNRKNAMTDFIFHMRLMVEFWKIISSGRFLSNDIIPRFENELGKFLGAKHVIGVGNCTDALMMSLRASGVGPGDEVIVPALGIMPTINAVVWIGAVPVFVDVEENTLAIDPNLIERAITPKTKAIVAVHLTGQMAAADKISFIAKKHNLYFIEDAARAIGAKYKNHSAGYWSDAACLSFNPVKILRGYGDGGAVVTNRSDLAEKVTAMRTYGAKGFDEVGISHPIIGNASRLNPFQAAILFLSMERMTDMIERWRRDYFLYLEYLRGIPHIMLPEIGPEYYTNGYQFILRTSRHEELYDFLRKQRAEVKRHYRRPLPYLEVLSYLGYKEGSFPVAEKISKQELWLPTGAFTGMRSSAEEVRRIANLIKVFFEESSSGRQPGSV